MNDTALTFPALGRLPLAREDVDRGCEQRARPDWMAHLWEQPQTRVFRLHDGLAPVHAGHIVLCQPDGELPDDAVYLGRSTEHSNGDESAELILITTSGTTQTPTLIEPEVAGQRISEDDQPLWAGVRDIAAGLTDRDVGILVEAVAVANWHARSPHCPRCGTKTTLTQSGWVRVCPQDGSEHFPRTDPAVIMAVTDRDDRILLGNNAAWGDNRYSTLAGFVEPGESLEAAVIREVHEESNLVVHSPQYLGSQPWPFPQSLMLGFTAVTDHPDEAVSDGEEMRQVRWFTKEELRQEARSGKIILPGAASIARSLLEHWHGGPLPEPRTLEN